MSVWNIFSIVVTGFAAIGPQIITAIPVEYRDLATTLIAMGGAVVHLYMPSPSAPK